jgi:hypothetical protein
MFSDVSIARTGGGHQMFRRWPGPSRKYNSDLRAGFYGNELTANPFGGRGTFDASEKSDDDLLSD